MMRSAARWMCVAGGLVLAVHGCIPGPLELARKDAAVEGSAGAPQDCASVCAEGCIKGTWTTACDNCVQDVCAAYDERFFAAPGANAYVTCSGAATDEASWQKCCSDNAQACDADMIVGSCACGFLAAGCKSECASLCGDKLPDAGCESCIPLSSCAMAWYDFRYNAQTTAFEQCMACSAGHCLSLCCYQYPDTCELYKAMRSCVCG